MSLRAVYERHAEAIEADFARYYQVHVGKLGTEELTYRRFGVLLRQLPRESAFVQATAGDAARWSTDNYLAAHVIDAVNLLRVHLLQVKGAKPTPKFASFPRPGVKADGNAETKMYAKFELGDLRKMIDRSRGGDPDG